MPRSRAPVGTSRTSPGSTSPPGSGWPVREFPLAPGHGKADYVLYVAGKLAGVIEAKKEGTLLTGNVLFEGGAGETIRRKLLHECDVHTLLRLPTGIFYAQGVKANVLFFEKKPGRQKPWTEKLWVYDLRTNKHFTLKTNPLKRVDLDEFVACYLPENRHQRKATWSEKKAPEGRWRSYGYEELLQRDKVSLDIFWLKDESLEDSANLPAPDVIAGEIVDDLRAALEQFEAIQTDLSRRGGAPRD